MVAVPYASDSVASAACAVGPATITASAIDHVRSTGGDLQLAKSQRTNCCRVCQDTRPAYSSMMTCTAEFNRDSKKKAPLKGHDRGEPAAH